MTNSLIDTDLACVKCGYNLRTLSATASCPECGETVAESLRVPGLTGNGREWVSRVRTGIVLEIVTFVHGILYTGAWFIFYYRVDSLMPLYTVLRRAPAATWTLAAMSVVDVIALWFITTPPPMATPPSPIYGGQSSPGLTVRQLLRYFIVISFWGELNYMNNPPRLLMPGLIDWLREAVNATTVFLFYLFVERDLTRPARLMRATTQARILKFIKPPIDCFLLTSIQLVFALQAIDRATEYLWFSVRDLLHIGLNILAIVLLYSVLKALPRPEPERNPAE